MSMAGFSELNLIPQSNKMCSEAIELAQMIRHEPRKKKPPDGVGSEVLVPPSTYQMATDRSLDKLE
jgi:hypothetical protein